LARNPIVDQEQDDLGYADLEADRLHVGLSLFHPERGPARPVVELERFRRYGPGRVEIEHAECPPHAHRVDCQPVPVEDQSSLVEHDVGGAARRLLALTPHRSSPHGAPRRRTRRYFTQSARTTATVRDALEPAVAG